MARPDAAPAQGVPCWLDLASPDVKASAAFYARVFGWTYDVSGPEMGHYHMALRDGRQVAGMGQAAEGDPTPPMWTVYFKADDAAAMGARAEKLGGSIVAGPMEVPGQGQLAVVRDPAGAVFGLWQPLGHHGFGVTHEHGSYGWCEVNVPDAEAARAFYAGLSGASARPLDDDAMPTTYLILSIGGDDAAGILQMTEEWEGIPPHWMAYFEVGDCDAAVAAVEDAGGSVSVEPFDTPWGRIAVLTDPFGAVFSVNQTPAG